jgi:L-ascorbate metabolism protein UlaG (beta-lactamase superfamily)
MVQIGRNKYENPDDLDRKIAMEITWVKGSNSWFWIHAGGKNIHIDPAYAKVSITRPDIVDKADLVLITHAHHDHFQKKTLDNLISNATVIIAPPNVAKKLGATSQVIAVAPGEEHDLGWVKVKAVYAYNFGLKGLIVHKKGTCVGYLLVVDGKTLYHAGDTELIPEMKQLGHVDLAMLPIGGRVTMDAEEAAEAAIAMGAKRVVPMHNHRRPVGELKTRLEKNPEIQVIVAEQGKPFEPF